MGLDDFKTDGNRTYTNKSSTKTNVGDVVHLPQNVDLGDIETPNDVVSHTVEYYTYIPASEDVSGTALCICNECSVTGSTYEAVVKNDHLTHRGEEWIDEYIEIAMNNKLEKPDTRPESIKNNDSNKSSGLDSFTS